MKIPSIVCVIVQFLAIPCLGIALGMGAFYLHIDIDWAGLGYSISSSCILAEALLGWLSKRHAWVEKLLSLIRYVWALALVLILATPVQAITADPANWWTICQKHWGSTLLPVGLVAFGLLIWLIASVLGPIRPNFLRSGRKVPLKPFLDRA